MAASRVACASFNIGTNTVISITRDNNAYTHTLTYKFGNKTGTIETKTSQTSIVWTPNASDLYSQIPDAVSGYGTVTCQTYNGNTLVGTTTAGFYAYAVKNECLPTVAATIEDTNPSTIALTGSSSKFINYISKPKVTVTATAKNSATIKSQQIDNVGLVATSSPYTFDTMYDKNFKITATDSRGYSTTKPYDVDMVDYIPCYISSLSLKRTESTSTTAALNLSGYCFKGSFGKESNSLTVKYRYKTTGDYGNPVIVTPTWNTDGTFTAIANIPNLSLNETYTFEVVVQDKLTSYGDDEEILLSQSMGDLRIAKDYVMTKNNIIIGNKNNTDWKGVIVKRKLSNVTYDSLIGAGNIGSDPATSIELKEEQKILGRFDIRKDGYMYNFLSNMSVAEIMSNAPSITTEGNQGYFLLNGGGTTPILVQWGRIHIVPTAANTNTKVQIHFPYEFNGTPIVKTERISGWAGVIHICPEIITSEGVTFSAIRDNTHTIFATWIAIGDGSNALPE